MYHEFTPSHFGFHCKITDADQTANCRQKVYLLTIIIIIITGTMNVFVERVTWKATEAPCNCIAII